MALDPINPSYGHNLYLRCRLSQPKAPRNRSPQEGRDLRWIIRRVPKPDLHKISGEAIEAGRLHGRCIRLGKHNPKPPKKTSISRLWSRDLQGSWGKDQATLRIIHRQWPLHREMRSRIS